MCSSLRLPATRSKLPRATHDSSPMSVWCTCGGAVRRWLGGSVRRCGGAAVRPWERWERWGGGGGGAVQRWWRRWGRWGRCGGAAARQCCIADEESAGWGKVRGRGRVQGAPRPRPTWRRLQGALAARLPAIWRALGCSGLGLGGRGWGLRGRDWSEGEGESGGEGAGVEESERAPALSSRDRPHLHSPPN